MQTCHLHLHYKYERVLSENRQELCSMAWESPWRVMPLTFLNSACAILDPIMEIQVLNYRICTFIHLAVKPSLLTAEIISLFLTAGHDIQEYPKTLCWELQDFTSCRLKVNNSLGFTDYYTRAGEVSECQKRASSSCLAFKVLQEFPALPQGAPLLLLNIPSGFPFVFSPGSKARGWKGGWGGICQVTYVHHNRGTSGCMGSNLGPSYSDMASATRTQLKNTTSSNKANAGKFCSFIADNSGFQNA